MAQDPYKIVNKRKRRIVKAADFLIRAAGHMGLVKAVDSPDLLAIRNHIHSILIIRLAYIGDVVMTLPVLDPLRQAFPEAEIHFLTSRSAAPLLKHQPSIDRIIEVDAPWFYRSSRDSAASITRLLKNRYQAGFDFRGDIRNIWHCLYRPGIPIRISYSSGGGGFLLSHPVAWTKLKHKIEYHLDLLRAVGIRAESRCPKISLTEPEISEAKELIAREFGEEDAQPVVIHPGARMQLKQWPADHFRKLAEAIRRQADVPVAVIDAPGSSAADHIADGIPGIVNLAGRLSVRQMAALMSLSRVVVCNDSGPMHIAAAVNAKTVALFGPSSPVETAPCGSGHSVIEASCHLKEHCDESSCLAHQAGCMNRIEVAEVLRHVAGYLTK